MMRWTIVAVACLVMLAGAPQRASAGAFTFAGEGNENRITHPIGYFGTGGVITNEVCFNTSVLPAGVPAATVENSILKAIDTWNKMRGSVRNLALSNNDIGGGQIDYESTLLHELGHCVGLAHPNLASESGLGEPQRNGTKSTNGVNNAFEPNAGGDGVHGSADDIRGDDGNLYWHQFGGNDPMVLPATIDTSTMTQSVLAGDLPVGDNWVANGDRTVLNNLGYPNTEAAMQQGAFSDEAQRRPTPEDVGQLELGMAGADGVAGTADDYTLELTYGGQVSSNSCDINIRFGPAFAFCQTGAFFINATHLRIAPGAIIELGQSTNWFYSQAPNTTTTVTDPGFSVGSSASVSVSVSRDSAAMSGNPSGDFEVSLGSDMCSGTLTGGSGSCLLTPSVGGAQTLTAEYLGFEGFDASEDSAAVTVGLATPTVTITSDAPDPSTVGQAYTVAVSVSGAVGTATGSVAVNDGSANCDITLSGGSGSCDLISTTVGAPKTITAAYSGDSSYTSGQTTEAHTVNQATPTVSITSDTPDPSEVGQAYTVAVTVSGGGATPTGSVTVVDGTDSCNVTLSSGSGSCDLTSTTVGAKTLTADYSGDSNYAAAQGTEDHTVNQATPTVTITGDAPDPSEVGQAYTVSVTVSGNGATPTGSVAVDDGTDSCNITLSGGSGSCDLTSTTAGAKTLTASYGGDANYATAQDTEAHTVNLATPTVTITSDLPDPSEVGQAYTVSVTVSGNGATPTGSVAVDDGTESCIITLPGGSGSCNLTSTTVGGKTLTAAYGGDSNYAAAQGTEDHTVNQATPTVTITSDTPDPSVVGQAYTVAVTVSGGGATPTGSVTVDDGAANCNITLTGGVGSCDLTSTTAGAKTLTAAYGGDSNYVSEQTTEVHTVNQATPTVAITSDAPDPSEVGQAYTVAVTVSGAGATPTGSVAVDDGTDSCNITLSGGSGSCDLTSTTVGAKTLTAAYGGDSNYLSGQNTEAHTVNQVTPTVTITSDSPDPSTVGQTYTVAVTVAGTAGTATGSVTVDDGADNCNITLSGGGGSCALVSATAGAKTLTAAYAGDASYSAAQDTEAHTVNQATPTVTITSDAPDPSEVGQAYTVSVTVSGGGATPSGAVSVDDGSDSCNIILSGGSGSCDLTSTTAGAKTLTAAYAGDSNYSAAQGTEAHTVNQATPTVTITSDLPDPSEIGQTYTVSVAVNGGGSTPTGSINVDDGLDSCIVMLSGGSGSCDLTSTTAGAKTLTAAYGGDANYTSAQGTEAHTVSLVTPTVMITGDTPDPSQIGQAYSVSVSVSGAGATPTGAVAVDDGTDSCNITLAAGSGSCDLISTTSGAKTLTAVYAGDSNYAAAQDSEAHTVSQATPTVTITSDTPDPSAVGQAYTVSVTVAGSAGTPTGSVAVDDGAGSCNIALLAGGGSCDLTSTTAGAKTLTAAYGGDGNYTTAQGSEAHTVDQAAPTVTITGDAPDPSAVGQPYTVSVTVSGAGATPSGSVIVDDGDASCNLTLAGGTGNCDLTSTTVGAKTLAANYGGDANYLAGQDSEAHMVSLDIPTVTITSDAPDPSEVGQAYTVMVSVTGPIGTPTGAVTVDDGSESCNITLAGGSGACDLISITAGAKTLTAAYGGDGNYAAAQDTEAHAVDVAMPTVTITDDSPDPSVSGQAYTVSVSVTSAVGTPTGTVTLSDGTDQCVTPALAGGSASCALISTTTGGKTLTATYAGDANFDVAQDTEPHTVNPPPTGLLFADGFEGP